MCLAVAAMEVDTSWTPSRCLISSLVAVTVLFTAVRLELWQLTITETVTSLWGVWSTCGDGNYCCVTVMSSLKNITVPNMALVSWSRQCV